MVDPAEAGADGSCPICGARDDDFLPPDRRQGRFARLSSFSQIVARLQWNANAIDLAPDARAWPGLPDERRQRLTTLLAGFRVAEDAVFEHLAPFRETAKDDLAAWVFFLQRRDEERHALLFDRIADEVLGFGATAEQRLAAARAYVPPAVLELFEVRLPAVAAELRAGRADLSVGVGLYHMVLEGIVFTSGQRALLKDLDDGVLPGVREGVTRVDLDERWHIGFGLRCLLEADASAELVDDVLAQAHAAAAAWGDAVPAATSAEVADLFARRLTVVGLIESRAEAA